MSRALLSLIAALALAGGALWFTTAARDPRAAPASAVAAVPPAPVELEPAVPVLSETPATTGADAREAAPRTPPAPADTRQELEGRVVFPPGTPADEEASVVLAGGDESGGAHAPVGADGRFRLAVGAGARRLELALHAHYLRLEEPARWTRGVELVLEPTLGARLVGRVSRPAGVRNDAETVIVLHAHGRGKRSVRAAVDASGAFAFDALAPEEELELVYDGASCVGRSDALTLAPGEGRELVLELRKGLALAGVVRDERGVPLEGVELGAEFDVNFESQSYLDQRRSAKSAADGRFRLRALGERPTRLSARLDGFRERSLELDTLPEAELETLALVLERGLALSGVVRWPDGRPAEAELVLRPLEGEERGFRELAGSSDADGRFAVSGLEAVPYRVTALAAPSATTSTTTSAGENVLSRLTGREREREQRTPWRAVAERVPAGTSELVLTLSSGLALAGRVVDDLGQAVDDFAVHAELALALHGGGRADNLAQDFRDAKGAFTLSGFTPGAWTLVATAKGHAASAPLEFALPAAAPALLVVPREAVVSGVVLDERGEPVGGARLSVGVAGAPQADSRACDEHGSFTLDGLAPGQVLLRARGPTGAPSSTLVLVLAPGEALAGATLRLRPSAMILGELLGAEDEPEPAQTVELQGPSWSERCTTDAEGRFECRGVPAGEITLRARTRAGLSLRQRVSVSEGETVHVRLAPAGESVRLVGTVRAGAEPFPEARLSARSANDENGAADASVRGRSDEAGEYALTLPGPGRYWVGVDGSAARPLSWRAVVEVPAQAEYRFDLVIPLGRISGRVLGADGLPLADIEVESEPERHEGGAHGSSSARTDEDGRYVLSVPAGQHAVTAGGGTKRFAANERPYAEARRTGLIVRPDEELRDVDLQLFTGGVLEGRVRYADGTGASGAELWQVEGARTRSLGRAAQDGAFRVVGLTPGAQLVGAGAPRGALREPARVEIVAGETKRLELELVPAVLVHLSVHDARGTKLGSELELLDEHGAHQRVQTGENGDAWLGPLLAGRYTVISRRDEGMAQRTFEVRGDERTAELELVYE